MSSKLFAALTIVCLLAACSSSGPPVPASTTFLNDARTNLKARDLDAASKNLDRTIKAGGTDDAAKQAEILRIALSLSYAKAAREMAEAYDTGRKQPAATSFATQFGRMHADYNGIARSYFLNALEYLLKQRPAITAQPLALALEFPEFSGADPAATMQIRSGTWIGDDARVRCEREMVTNQLARLLARLAGAGEDVHKGHSAFTQGAVALDSRVYLIETAAAISDQSEMFGQRDLDQPKYMRTALETAIGNLEAAAKLFADKPDKALESQSKKVKDNAEKLLKKMS